jgi:5-formyltetrahydrofolate cyclo-ligase
MGPVDDVTEAKSELRRALLERRAQRDEAERSRAAEALAARVLASGLVPAAETGRSLTVAAYVSRTVEPGTALLLDHWLAAGVRVLVPVAQPGHVLDWAVFAGHDALAPSPLPGHASLREPTGPLLGPDTLGAADLVLVPALAVTADGTRLGHGAGYYDRALAYVRDEVLTMAVVFDDEVLDQLPATAHDRPVRAVVTPERLLRVAPQAPGTP